jgi:hypothetical protein
LQLISVVDNTKRIVESLKAAQNQAQNPGVPGTPGYSWVLPAGLLEALTPIDEVERVALPATQEHKEVSEFIVSPNAKFKAGDIILGKHEDHGDKLFAGMVMAPLATLFKEVDADGDDKLSFDEWRGRLGKLVSEKVLRKLFDECDTDKNGTIDLEEFTVGLANKYEITWAQEPQTDGIKDANEICLAPDPDLYRQEVASQKEAKERQLQQLKELDELMKSLKPPQEEENNVCDQCEQQQHPCLGLALLSCCCCWVCYLVFLILGAVMLSLLIGNSNYDFNALADHESWRITAVETWSAKPGDGATWSTKPGDGWWCINGHRLGMEGQFRDSWGTYCGVDLEVFLSQMNNKKINQTYCKSCESYTDNVKFRGEHVYNIYGQNVESYKGIVYGLEKLVHSQKNLCRDFYRYTVKTQEGNYATTVACSCRPAGTTVEQCTRKSPSQTPVSEVGSLVEIWRPRTNPVSDLTAIYWQCGDAQCYQTEDPIGQLTKQSAWLSTVWTLKHYTNVAAVVLSVLFVFCLAHTFSIGKWRRSRRPAPSSAICARCGRQNPRYLRHGLLREHMMT